MKLVKPKFDPPELLGLNKSLRRKTGYVRDYLYLNRVHLDQNKTAFQLLFFTILLNLKTLI